MSESITLTGKAIYGIEPPLQRLGMAAPAQTVKLGRKRIKARPQALRLSNYLDYAKIEATIPVSVDYSAKAAASLSRMYLNDTYGDCVVASAMHQLGLWTGNDSDSGGIVLASDQEVSDQYFGICGPGDNGCIITDVLDYARDHGLKASGKNYKIDGYVSIDWGNKLEVQVALLLFGSIKLGINLPEAWTNASTWDVTNTQIVGGHDVPCVAYDGQGVTIASWARKYLITWAAFTSKRWLEEAYVVLSPNWYNADNLAPNGFNAAALKADLAKLGGGVIPDIDPPAPPTPPTPPPLPPGPTDGTYTLDGMLTTTQDRLAGTLVCDGTKAYHTGTIALSNSTFKGAIKTNAAALGIPAGFVIPPALWPLIIEYGVKVVPVIVAGIAAHHSLLQILRDVYAVLDPTKD